MVAIVADVGKVGGALATFDWRLLPVALALTLSNYALRWVRWHRYLGLFTVRAPVAESVGIFFGGLGMAITPGKLGEFVKAVLLQQSGRAPYAVVVPIVVAERLADGVAMTLLALLGIASLGKGPGVIVLTLIPAVLLIVVVRWRRLAEWVLSGAARLPVIGPVIGHARGYYESAYALFGPRVLLTAVGMGLMAWFAEALALVVILSGLGIADGGELVLQATAAMAVAVLMGGLSFLPGGLGLAEGGLVGLLLLVVPQITLAEAAAATMLFRLVTFWFGVSLGVVALAWVLRRLGTAGSVPPGG